MNETGPIILIDDDPDDQAILLQCLEGIGIPNRVIIFTHGDEAIDFLRRPEIEPFLIIFDINMPKSNGFDLRRMILNEESLAKKCIPFLFLTTSSSAATVDTAYSLNAQGVFEKPASMDGMKAMLRTIIDYWRISLTP